MKKQEPVMDWPAIKAELHRNGIAARARLRRRNIGQRPNGLQIDHFALPSSL